MASIQIYSTKMDISKNQVVEGISNYLGTCTCNYSSANLQYIKPALEVSVKIDLTDGLTGNVTIRNALNSAQKPNLGNYARIFQRNEASAAVVSQYQTRYYFITDARWISSETVELDLALDTLNTYWSEITPALLPTTHITRRHKDRLKPTSEENVYARIVDRQSEGLAPVQYKTTSAAVYADVPASLTYAKWYLVYKTASSEANSQVYCYCCADSGIPKYASQTASTVTLNYDYFEDGRSYYFLAEDGFYPYVTGSNDWQMQTTDQYPIIYIYRSGGQLGYMLIRRDGHYAGASTGTSVKVRTSKKYYLGPYQDTPLTQISDIEELPTTNLTAGTVGAVEVAPISSLNRYDPLLIKVMELPYPPFKPTMTGGYIDTPTGWTFDSSLGMFKLNDLNQEFECDLKNQSNTVLGSHYAHALATTDTPQINAESKLWHSDFHTLKFVYDSFTWQYKPELADNYDGTPGLQKLGITYKPSNGISNYSAFQFKDNYFNLQEDADFSTYMVCQRDNDLPLYNSEWLNYLKYGKRYDDSMNTAAAIKSTTGFIGGLAASAIGAYTLASSSAGAGLGVGGAVAGAVVGAIVSTISLAAGLMQTYNAQEQKEAQLQSQSISVKGNNDLNIMDWYTADNKMIRMVYDPSDQIRNTLWKLFFYTGYACDEYAVPTFSGRYRFDYVVCEPKFDESLIGAYHDYISEISQRLQLGVTVLHNNSNFWDFGQQYENWETSCLS